MKESKGSEGGYSNSRVSRLLLLDTFVRQLSSARASLSHRVENTFCAHIFSLFIQFCSSTTTTTTNKKKGGHFPFFFWIFQRMDFLVRSRARARTDLFYLESKKKKRNFTGQLGIDCIRMNIVSSPLPANKAQVVAESSIEMWYAFLFVFCFRALQQEPLWLTSFFFIILTQ